MAKTKLKAKESKRTKDIETLEVEFIQDQKNIKKGYKHKFHLDTAVDLCIRGMAVMTTEAGKKVMSKVREEEKDIQEKIKERKAAKKG